jgi:3-hydroxybutyrate dehydrogenase
MVFDADQNQVLSAADECRQACAQALIFDGASPFVERRIAGHRGCVPDQCAILFLIQIKSMLGWSTIVGIQRYDGRTMTAGKAAIVTGSTSGIGLGIARALAGAGYDIMLNGFGEQSAIEHERARIAKDFGVRAVFNPADMTKPAEIEGMVEAATGELGRVDILVNNAGIQHTAPVEEFPIERWDAVIAINLSSSFHAIRAVVPQMRQRNWGRIINIASAHGLVASVDKAAYVAAKHGLVGLTKVVALETATTGITCNAICPGWVLTPLVQKQIGERASHEKIPVEQARIELLSEKQPSHEFATPEQIGALTVFLCSDAAGQIRGAALPVDGGWTAQ